MQTYVYGHVPGTSFFGTPKNLVTNNDPQTSDILLKKSFNFTTVVQSNNDGPGYYAESSGA